MIKHSTLIVLLIVMGAAPLFTKAQCSVKLTSSTACGVPAVLRAEADFVPYRIEWKRDGSTIRNDSASWSSIGIIMGDRASTADDPGGVWVNKQGQVYFPGLRSNIIYLYDQGSPTSPTVVAGTGQGTALNQMYRPSGLWMDDKDTLFVADLTNNRIMKFPPNSTSATNGAIVAGPASGGNAGSSLDMMRDPYDLFGDDNGNIYVADAGNNRILKFPKGSKAGTAGTVIAGGNGAGSALNQLNYPIGVHVDKQGYVYVADLSNQRVLKFPPNSTSATMGTVVAGGNGVGNGLNQFTRARAVFVDGYGNIYVTDDGSPTNTRVMVFPPNSSSSTMGKIIAGGSGVFKQYAAGLYVSDSGHIFFAEANAQKIKKFTVNLPKDTLTATQAGNYTATLYGFNGCVQTASVTVSASGGPTLALGANPSVCVGVTTASLTYSNPTGSPNQYNISWSAAAISAGFVNQTNQTLSGGAISIAIPGGATAGNTYTGTLTVRNSSTGCVSGNYSFSVILTSGVTITPGATPAVCKGATSAPLSYTATGSPNQYSIAWSGAAQSAGFTNVTNQAIASSPINVTVPGSATPATYTGTLTMRNSSSSCVSTTSNISVIINALPNASITPAGPIEICVGQSATLTAGSGAGYSFQWKNAQGAVGSGGSYSASATGNYYVVVTDGNNCKDSSSPVLVTSVPLPQVSILPGDTAFCNGEFVRLEAISSDTGLNYQWKKDNSLVPATADFLEVNTSGIYSVIVSRKNISGCSDSAAEVEVKVHPLPTPSIDWDGTLLTTDDYYDSYQWMIAGQPIIGAAGASYQPDTIGSYSVMVTDSNGCVGTSSAYQVNELHSGVKSLQAQEIAIYPNPATNEVYIHGPKGISVLLRGMDGRVIYRKERVEVLNISQLPAGLYYLQIFGEDGLLLKNSQLIKINQ